MGPSRLRYSVILQWLLNTYFVRAEQKSFQEAPPLGHAENSELGTGKQKCNWNQTNTGILKSSKIGSALFPNLHMCGSRVRKNIGSDMMTYTCKDAQNHSAANYLVML